MPSDEQILEAHRKFKGKVSVELTTPISSKDDLALAYTPGVAVASNAIASDTNKVWELTGRRNRVAIVSDGTAVLGLGNIGPEAAMPVMEGKAALFKQFADVDAFPICLATQDTDEIIATVKALAPSFGGINLEDISAPRCFEIEETLKRELSIPVFHDDQHGTAIVLLAALINAFKLTKRSFESTKIVINGAGAAGTAIARILLSQGAKNILILDRKGIIHRKRSDLNSEAKTFLAAATNPENVEGSLEDAMKGADVFIGVSAPGLVNASMIQSMNDDPIIFAMANPDPEIMPEEAKKAGAVIVATGRSDYPNQVNNILAFPGIFRAALDAEAEDITEDMKLAAAHALSECVDDLSPEKILPDPLEEGIAQKVAEAVTKVV
jgi:malate dehydrogenase (oxaloacetate-decarboxylating)